MTKTLAVIPAGGSGTRMGGGVPKQYRPLAGIPVLVHTLRRFQDSPCIDGIILALPEGDLPMVRRDLVLPYGLTKVEATVPGGPERQASVRNALRQAGPGWDILVVHDGVRPLVSAALIARVVEAARQYGAVTVGLPVKETVKEVGATGWVERTLERQPLWLTQTPQAFSGAVLREAYERAEAAGITATDDAGLVERLGIPVKMLPGEERNIKLTTAADLALAEHWLSGLAGPAESGL